MAVASLVLPACDTQPNVAQAMTDLAPAAKARLTSPKPQRCPESMALAGDVCVDRWEAHLVDVATGKPMPAHQRPPEGVAFAAGSAPGVKPQGYVSRDEAAQACARAGKRLCRAREWYGACTGPKRTRYPYGSEVRAGACNTGKPHLPTLLFGAGTPITPLHYNSPKLALHEGFLADTGSHADCVNDYGLADMVGNLHEWVSDAVSARLKDEVPLEYGAHKLGRRGKAVFMGGYFSSQGEHGRGCAYATTNHAAGYHDYSTGFRCCADSGVASP